MFFTGKVLWLIFQPLSLSFLLMLSATILGFKWKRIARAVSALGLVTMFVVLFTNTGSWVLQKLEDKYVRGSIPDQLGCMIVLGGGMDLEVTAKRGAMEMNQAADRYFEAARLARLYPGARIVISGGDGSFSGIYKGDAELAPALFEGLGIEASRLLMDKTSRNTIENVRNTKDILTKNDLDHCLLITSAYHMPRAMALFEPSGLHLMPWPADYRTSGKISWALDFTQPTLNAHLSSTAAREWIAILVTQIRS